VVLKRLHRLCAVSALVAASLPSAALGQPAPAAASAAAQPRTGAAAQPAPVPQRDRRWEVEAHAGYVSVLDQRSGSGSLPTTGSLVQGLLSASTFAVGQGAQLFNENQAARGTGSPIVPLDPVLLAPAAMRDRIFLFGARFDRRLSRRVGIEIAGEYRRGRLLLRQETLAGFETTRASLESALQGALSRFPVPSAVSTVTAFLDDQQANQLVATGSLIVNLRDPGGVIPYLAFGGGVMMNDVTSPRARVVGTYQIGSPAQILYSDGVEMSIGGEGDRAYVGVAGGGLKVPLSSRWGVRLDARANVFKNRTVNLVDILPGSLLQSTGQPFPILTSGTVQFSAIAPLTGSPAVAAPTFSGSGFQAHVVLSTGLFVRF
jgi:hypothetical protein